MSDMFTSWKPEDLPSWVPKDRYEITATKLTGMNSGRTRFKVVCKVCQKQIHEATTDPNSWIKYHEEDEHGKPQ